MCWTSIHKPLNFERFLYNSWAKKITAEAGIPISLLSEHNFSVTRILRTVHNKAHIPAGPHLPGLWPPITGGKRLKRLVKRRPNTGKPEEVTHREKEMNTKCQNDDYLNMDVHNIQ